MAKKPVGRPTLYTDPVAHAICLRMAEGESLRSICRDPSMPGRSAVLEWLADPDREDFRAKYRHARDMQADLLFEEMREIADTPVEGVKTVVKATGTETTTGDMIEHRKLQVETRKWQASKLAPKKYGDRQTIEHTDPTGANPFQALLEAIASPGRPKPAAAA